MMIKIILLSLILLVAANVYSTQIVVPTDYSSIQTAVDSASVGDTVVILEGHYFQRAIIDSKAITIASEFILDGNTGHIANTVIDADTSVVPAGDTGSVLIVSNISTGQVKVIGLTIQNGVGSLYKTFGIDYNVGGGILCAEATVQISNCVVRNNRCVQYGGGICSYSSDVQIENCTIQENTSLNDGGGLSLLISAGSIVDSCQIINNSGKNGGGIYIPFAATTIQNSVFDNNNGLLGGALYIEDNSTDIINCQFYENTGFKGGAVYGFQQFNGGVDGCTFVSNVAFPVGSVPGLGGAICLLVSQPLISNCTMYANSADSGGAIYANNQADAVLENCIIANSLKGRAYVCSSDSRPALFCTYVFGNTGGNFIGCISGWQHGNNNKELDPQFCLTTSRDVSLKDTSPCLPSNNACSLLIGANDMGCIATDINDDFFTLPSDYQLSQNYPNPFNPSTVIAYSIPMRSSVRILVTNMLGRQVVVLINETKSAGSHEITWNGRDQNGEQVSSGVYFYSIEAGEFSASRKMLLIR